MAQLGILSGPGLGSLGSGGLGAVAVDNRCYMAYNCAKGVPSKTGKSLQSQAGYMLAQANSIRNAEQAGAMSAAEAASTMRDIGAGCADLLGACRGIGKERDAFRAGGGCDATRAGLLAETMKDTLRQAGGKPSAGNVFGKTDCTEWKRLFKSFPDPASVRAKEGLDTWVCPSVSVPDCGALTRVTLPIPPPPTKRPPVKKVPPIPVLPTPKPGVSTANMLMYAGIAAAVGVGGYYLAKQRGWL